MKKFLLLIIGICAFISTFAQNNSQDLELNVIQESDNQIISAPASLAGESDLIYDFISSPALRTSGNSGPVSPMAIPANDNCANAILLTMNAPCVTGTNKESTIQAGENAACQGAITKSVWYRFVATATTHYVEVERTASSGCYLSSAVYSNACLPSTSIACEDAALGPNLNIHNLTGLTIGNTYYIQVSYTAGGPCGPNNNAATGADFCIKVGRPVNCNTCATPCGPICTFATTPTVAQVTSTCSRYDLVSRLNAGQVRTQCYTFTAVAANFSLQMIINTVGCSGGNVTTFDWQLYPASCAAAVQSGNLANLNANGLTIGSSYVLCYTWTAACQHNSVYPYIVATSPLPVELMEFNAVSKEKSIELNWITASETGNELFSIQRSEDGINFNEIGSHKGAGNSNNLIKYSFTDNHPVIGINYYRLTQVDFDNSRENSKIIAVRYKISNTHTVIEKNPVTDIVTLKVDAEHAADINITIFNQYGKMVISANKSFSSGRHDFNIPVENLSGGMYHLNIQNGTESAWIKFLKM